MQPQSPGAGGGETIDGSRAPGESWPSVGAQTGSQSGKVRSCWGSEVEVGLASGRAGGGALQAGSGSVDGILGVLGSHGRLEERSSMVSLAFEMAPNCCEGQTGDREGD